MTVYAWPSAWVPSAFELRILPNTRTFVGAYTPTVQVVDLLGERWCGRIDLPATADQDLAGAMEAWFDRLKGPANQFGLWNFRRPVPRGTLRGSPTLGADAAQGANTATLANCFPTNNLLSLFNSFDNAAWSKVGGAVTANGLTAPDGSATADTFTEDTSTGGHYLARSFAFSNATTYTFSVYVKAVAGTRYACLVLPSSAFGSNKGIVVNLSTGAILNNTGSVTAAVSDAGNGWWRISAGATTTAASTTFPQIRSQSATSFAANHTGDGAGAIGVWGAQLEVGTLTPFQPSVTVKAGDMLGINGQLVRAMVDATSDDSGAMSIEFQPRLRAAQSSGASVAWNAPTCNVMLRSDGVPITHHPGYADGVSFEFVEVV